MKTFIYRVYDDTCDRPCSIFEASSDDVAERAFFALYPPDSAAEYSLYRICACSANGLDISSDFLLIVRGKPDPDLDDDEVNEDVSTN